MNRLTSSRLTYGAIVVLALPLFVIGYVVGRDVLAGAATLEPTLAPGSGAALVDPPFELPDFTLTRQMGDTLSLTDLRGRPVMMFFGYTHCPDVCPATLATYKRVKSLLGERADDVAFMFISVDGARDTPQVVADYLARIDPAFIGLTGTQTELEAVGQAFGLITNRVSPGDAEHEHGNDHREDLDNDHYFVEHTSPSFLVDAEGKLRMVYFYGTSADVMASGIRQLF